MDFPIIFIVVGGGDFYLIENSENKKKSPWYKLVTALCGVCSGSESFKKKDRFIWINIPQTVNSFKGLDVKTFSLKFEPFTLFILDTGKQVL